MASDFSNLLERLNIKFNDIHLLETAFTHRSYLNEVKDVKASNERLEFLGDSILSFIISTYLYSSRPKDPEGDLTNLRSYIVKTKSLAEASEKLELGKYLKLSKGEEISGGRYNTQLLANTFEALLGAIFLDLGLETATKIIHQTLLPDFRNELEAGPPKDSKSELQELAQEKLKESPHYKIIGTKGPDHAKEFMVAVFIKGKEVGRGTGSSKQAAEEMAALNALKSFT
ncbi:ribonuclease III [Candidatus Daviesbacteria bacterium RIFCSPHIGHO2_12_FULL_37_11]|uniref:Ribonuclease 3 n=1 Tax=Candidatus Daviesbacteria bacterium RIFCSPHIGHO2_12_FULL_37_11 TaxID=1797777 RepID=A0A1F5KBM1_9BACT|nr:MAG: ribonuclease III [Candidatus Daviesbacteria bacterium GWA1_38_6]OGE38214.1 MAG: ribonuclease III [Candidatus Daviesbacteria bacterium RIFCSPHIGHO2_12_FULL_37_11]OGE45886.1 MAG: ribonuclease III [Candidatus Daviesbacteria bacterium RIFCSPLOWO2_01_FULL_37_10]